MEKEMIQIEIVRNVAIATMNNPPANALSLDLGLRSRQPGNSRGSGQKFGVPSELPPKKVLGSLRAPFGLHKTFFLGTSKLSFWVTRWELRITGQSPGRRPVDEIATLGSDLSLDRVASQPPFTQCGRDASATTGMAGG